jgi:hypothetical protein
MAKKNTVKGFWKSFNIRYAIDIIVKVWSKVSQSCKNGVWKTLLSHFVYDFQGFELGNAIKILQQQCVALAKEVGFDEVEGADVVKLLESHKEELSDEELMQLHEELGLVPKDPEADVCDEDAPVQNLPRDILM